MGEGAITEHKERVQMAADALMDEAIAGLQQLVRFPSVTGDEGRAQEHLAGRLKDLGAEVDFWYPQRAELEDHPAFPMVNCGDLGSRPNVVGVWRGQSGGRSLILNGHIDVVSPGREDRWEGNPWSGDIRGGRLYGRGSCDMKGGLLAAVFAREAIRRAGLELKGDVFVESVIGEEDGGVGTLATLVRGYRAGGAVIMEPSRLALVPAQAGAMTFRLTVPGKAAHGSTRYEGASALEKFVPILQALTALEARINAAITDPLFSRYPIKAPLSIGYVRSGVWGSMVPEELVAEGRYGFYRDPDATGARQAFEAAVAEVAAVDPWLRENPPQVEWIRSLWEPAAIAEGHPLRETFEGAYRGALGAAPVVEGVPYGSDMRLLTNYGQIPTLIFGPGDIAQAHFTNEYVSLEDYAKAIKVLAAFIADWCGVAWNAI